MKINVKTIIIVFLVALLGSGLGTFGVLSFYNSNIGNGKVHSDVVLNEVAYTSIEKGEYTKAIEKAYDTVVEITCTVRSSITSDFFFFGGGTTESTSAGSGVIFSSDGYIITNEHVIRGLASEDSIQVKLYTGEVYGAKVIGSDARTDLAVLKIEEDGLPFASLADSSQLVLGQDVIAIGNPLGSGISCSNGIVSALEKEIYINNVYMTVIQTNAAVNAGNSGGGLFDINGNLIGIVNAKNTSTMTTEVEGMSYAIPSNTVIRIISDLIENGYVKDRAALGIRVYTSSSFYQTNGVVVSEVIAGGSAETAGIQANDIITAIDGEEVSGYADLSKILDAKSIGEKVVVSIVRNEEKLEIPVILQASTSN
ncbi:MAG: trypsin-like peptidase domain-containing protein [Erysipelotrichaceae bacterium]|nr:trypsin-like peptidase domain-containing protein [Erysipelotrichaceae bacterium]